MQYEYFYGAQAEQFSFYRIPKALFTEPNFRELSTDAKVLYPRTSEESRCQHPQI